MRSDIATLEAPSATATPIAGATGSTRTQIAYVTYLRAVAILLIVTGHTYALAWTHGVSEDPTLTPSIANMLPALINGGTSLFVFISGYLYREVFYRRVGYGAFMRKKALYVGLPYLIVATPVALAEIALGTFDVAFFKDGAAYAPSYFIDYVVLMTTGRMVTAYWYIPCAFLLFLAAPLFDRFIELTPRSRIAILLTSLGVALWIHRPADNLNPLQSFVYFANLYLLGIIVCEHRRVVMAFVTQNRVMLQLVSIALLIAALQAIVGHIDNIERAPGDGLLPLGVDLMLLQKYALIFALVALLARFGSVGDRPLDFLARHSFGIFFAHGVILAVLNRFPDAWTPHSGIPLLDLAAYAVLVIALSILAVLIVKRMTGRYSRYVIGC